MWFEWEMSDTAYVLQSVGLSLVVLCERQSVVDGPGALVF